MKLKKLIIRKHKNFNNLEIDFSECSGVAAFIGNNGSGKSNILEALSSLFKALYLDEKDEFDYFLEYETFSNVSVKITSGIKGRIYAINGNPVYDIKEVLPKRVIAIYSGEEDRLWKKYYEPVYLKYIAGINNANVLEYPRMFYLNKFYWNIILLSLLVSEADDVKQFVKDKLGINIVNEIKFKFYKDRYKDYNASPALSFIKRIDQQESYSLEEFKNKIKGDYNAQQFNNNDFFVNYDSTDVFQSLYIAFTDKNKKLIDDIEVTFNDALTLNALSEGQKKMLLIKSTLEFASSEDTLILLDEPDAHIHINNKEQITKVFEPYQSTRQIVITTHSPTLTQSFKDENVFMLTDGELIKKDRQSIINILTKDFWSKQEQNAFLGDNRDTILVEGKTDIVHIKTALDKLKTIEPRYSNLNFKFLPFNGASGLKLFVDEFPVNKSTKTFAFLDRDQAGMDAIKETLNFEGKKDEFKGQIKNHIYIDFLPKKEGYTESNFVIEDFYPFERFTEFLLKDVNSVTTLRNHKDSKFKNGFAEMAKQFDVDDFMAFKKLFDLILVIKDEEHAKEKPASVAKINNQHASSEEIVPLNLKAYAHHIEYTSVATWQNFLLLRDKLLRLNPKIDFASNKYFISIYIHERNLAVIRFRKSAMNIEVKFHQKIVSKFVPQRNVRKNTNGSNIGNIYENEDFGDVINMLYEISLMKR